MLARSDCKRTANVPVQPDLYCVVDNLPPRLSLTVARKSESGQYIQLQQAEAAFRLSKSDLGLRPIFHQKTERVEAHILVCFLALALWRTLEMWMQSKGLGTCARQFLKEIATVRSLDVVLPVKDRPAVRLRLVTKPDRLLAELLAHLDLELPNAPKIIGNVVEKNGV